MNCVIIADEITAVGWRLAGLQVQIPDASGVAECFGAALRGADLVLITAALAALLPDMQLRPALLLQRPLLMVIADLRHGREPPDIDDEVRRALGVAV
ncbi:MAG: Vacuolar H+transporting two-sector ATPase F subunit [Gammaproteobacteria bacterium]